MVAGEAASSTKGGTLGARVAVLTRAHHQARAAQHFCIEGCGFSAVELRVKGVSLLLLSVYLKNSTPLHCPPNAEILSRLVAILKHRTGPWLVAGDFNVEPQEIAVTTLVQELGGQIICTGEPTMRGGSELDFGTSAVQDVALFLSIISRLFLSQRTANLPFSMAQKIDV